MRVLVDTSIWSLALRRRPKELSAAQRKLCRELTELIQEGRVALIGPIRQEILSGLRDPQDFERLCEYLSYFDDETLTREDFEEAARIHNRCRAAGVSGSAIDFLICAAATRRTLSIFTSDGDFRHYSTCTPLRLHEPRP